jgi:hypothetical protein
LILKEIASAVKGAAVATKGRTVAAIGTAGADSQ